ncbi:MAG: plasmid replication initiator TrfA [Deltaproteobacteria bacterium]|jgi:hypothetical protein|nr:plasmid replication initiator TrfA [Deltaproteobacteria bacterium]
MPDLILKKFEKISIFKWFNSAGFFTHEKERLKLPVDKFTLVGRDSIQNIDVFAKSLRLNIDDEILLSALIEKSKEERTAEISITAYELSKLVFNKTNSESYKKIKESLNALKACVIQLSQDKNGFIFNFIDSLIFEDNLNEKGRIKIRLSKEIYDFFIKKNDFLTCIDTDNYRRLTGGRIQKLLFLYFKSVCFTIPTPLSKIQEILQLNNLRAIDFKRCFSEKLISTLKKEGVYIQIQGDRLIYKKSERQKLIETKPTVAEFSKSKMEDYLKEPKIIGILETLKINKPYILNLCKKYHEGEVITALKKIIHLHTSTFQEIKNPSGFLQAMLKNGTYNDLKQSRQATSVPVKAKEPVIAVEKPEKKGLSQVELNEVLKKAVNELLKEETR